MEGEPFLAITTPLMQVTEARACNLSVHGRVPTRIMRSAYEVHISWQLHTHSGNTDVSYSQQHAPPAAMRRRACQAPGRRARPAVRPTAPPPAARRTAPRRLRARTRPPCRARCAWGVPARPSRAAAAPPPPRPAQPAQYARGCGRQCEASLCRHQGCCTLKSGVTSCPHYFRPSATLSAGIDVVLAKLTHEPADLQVARGGGRERGVRPALGQRGAHGLHAAAAVHQQLLQAARHELGHAGARRWRHRQRLQLGRGVHRGRQVQPHAIRH